MFGYLSLQENLETVDSLVKSTEKLVEIFRETPEINETFHSTLKQVFIFIHKIMSLMPQVLISPYKRIQIKEEVLFCFSRVEQAWSDYNSSPEYFYDTWYEFIFWWEEFYKILAKVKNSGNTIFLSLN